MRNSPRFLSTFGSARPEFRQAGRQKWGIYSVFCLLSVPRAKAGFRAKCHFLRFARECRERRFKRHQVIVRCRQLCILQKNRMHEICRWRVATFLISTQMHKKQKITKNCINILTNPVYKFNICNIETVKELITMKKRRRKGQMTSRNLSGLVVHLSAWNQAQR